MKKTLLSVGASAILGLALQVVPTVARATDLPTANCGLGPTNTCLVFGDFTVYSLPLLQEYQDPSGATPDYPLTSSLQGLNLLAKPNEATVRIISTGLAGTAVQGTGTSIDDAFDARTGSAGAGQDNMMMLMVSAGFSGGAFSVPSDPAGGPAADNVLGLSATVVNTSTFNTTASQTDLSDPADYAGNCFADLNGCFTLWDADVAALRTALGTGDLVFFFNNNETGDSGTLDGQDLTAWMRVCLSDSTGVQATQCFTLDGTGQASVANGFADAQTAGVDDILPTAGDLWAHVHSDICVQEGTGIVFPGTCAAAGVTGKTIDNSLGADEANFAIFNAQLNALVKDASSGYDTLTVDGRLAHINNGGDILWITAVDLPDEKVPEPATLALVGLALAGLGLSSRRRRSA